MRHFSDALGISYFYELGSQFSPSAKLLRRNKYNSYGFSHFLPVSHGAEQVWGRLRCRFSLERWEEAVVLTKSRTYDIPLMDSMGSLVPSDGHFSVHF